MVRSAKYRSNKYDKKVTYDIVADRFKALKDSMQEQASSHFATLVQMEEDVKSIVETEGVATMQVPFYLNYGRELYKKDRKFDGATFENEAGILATKWDSRGLEMSILNKIAQLFGIALPGY